MRLRIGDWIRLANGRRGQVWSEAPAQAGDVFPGWWVAVNDLVDGPTFVQVDVLGHEVEK